jgi:hypothetical protein
MDQRATFWPVDDVSSLLAYPNGNLADLSGANFGTAFSSFDADPASIGANDLTLDWLVHVLSHYQGPA